MLITNYNAIYKNSTNRLKRKTLNAESSVLDLKCSRAINEDIIDKKELKLNFLIDVVEFIKVELTERIEERHLDLL